MPTFDSNDCKSSLSIYINGVLIPTDAPLPEFPFIGYETNTRTHYVLNRAYKNRWSDSGYIQLYVETDDYTLDPDLTGTDYEIKLQFETEGYPFDEG